MGTNTTIGLDLAKLVFSVCEQDAGGRNLQRKDLRRVAVAPWLAQLPAGTIVAMEACSGAHHWARRCQAYGLDPKLIAAQFVAPFRKSQTTKNDRNDAEAIATAARQGNMRFVPVKTVDQQARLAWHRVREGYKTEVLATSNRIRGVLAEFGVVVARNDQALLRVLGDTAIRPGLPSTLLELLDQQAAHWRQLRERLAECDRHIADQARADPRCVRVQQLTGVGALTADAMVASVGNATEFKNGRQLSAWLGLVPTQHSSGGRAVLGEISCRGDRYLRTLLIQGARSSLQRAQAVATERATPEQVWICALARRLPFGKVLVAIANKHARQIWAMLARDEDYDPHAWLRHPMVQRPRSKRAPRAA
ncbi:MAG: IS110 family transposase [Pseudomonas sp.]